MLDRLSVEEGDDLTALQFLHLLHKQTPVLIDALVLPVGEVDLPRRQFLGILLAQLFYELNQQLMGILLLPPTHDLDPILQHALEFLVVVPVPTLLEGEELGRKLLCLFADRQVRSRYDFEEDLHHCRDVAGIAQVGQPHGGGAIAGGTVESDGSFLGRGEEGGAGVAVAVGGV
jgi:hypothetical protein